MFVCSFDRSFFVCLFVDSCVRVCCFFVKLFVCLFGLFVLDFVCFVCFPREAWDLDFAGDEHHHQHHHHQNGAHVNLFSGPRGAAVTQGGSMRPVVRSAGVAPFVLCVCLLIRFFVWRCVGLFICVFVCLFYRLY